MSKSKLLCNVNPYAELFRLSDNPEDGPLYETVWYRTTVSLTRKVVKKGRKTYECKSRDGMLTDFIDANRRVFIAE